MSLYDTYTIENVREILKNYFLTGKKPTEKQFHFLIDSILDKNVFNNDLNLECKNILNLSSISSSCSGLPIFINNDIVTNNVSAVDLVIRNLTAQNVDILNYEISGFEITGDLGLQTNLFVSGSQIIYNDLNIHKNLFVDLISSHSGDIFIVGKSFSGHGEDGSDISITAGNSLSSFGGNLFLNAGIGLSGNGIITLSGETVIYDKLTVNNVLSAPNLKVSNLTADYIKVDQIDITNLEIQGYTVSGDLVVSDNVIVDDCVITDCLSSFSGDINITGKSFDGLNEDGSNIFINAGDSLSAFGGDISFNVGNGLSGNGVIILSGDTFIYDNLTVNTSINSPNISADHLYVGNSSIHFYNGSEIMSTSNEFFTFQTILNFNTTDNNFPLVSSVRVFLDRYLHKNVNYSLSANHSGVGGGTSWTSLSGFINDNYSFKLSSVSDLYDIYGNYKQVVYFTPTQDTNYIDFKVSDGYCSLGLNFGFTSDSKSVVINSQSLKTNIISSNKISLSEIVSPKNNLIIYPKVNLDELSVKTINYKDTNFNVYATSSFIYIPEFNANRDFSFHPGGFVITEHYLSNPLVGDYISSTPYDLNIKYAGGGGSNFPVSAYLGSININNYIGTAANDFKRYSFIVPISGIVDKLFLVSNNPSGGGETWKISVYAQVVDNTSKITNFPIVKTKNLVSDTIYTKSLTAFQNINTNQIKTEQIRSEDIVIDQYLDAEDYLSLPRQRLQLKSNGNLEYIGGETLIDEQGQYLKFNWDAQSYLNEWQFIFKNYNNGYIKSFGEDWYIENNLHVQKVSTNSLVIGSYTENSFIVTNYGSGLSTINISPTAGYNAAFYNLVIINDINVKASNFVISWSSAGFSFSETTTTDVGSTSSIKLSAGIVGEQVVLQSNIISGNWTIKGSKKLI